MSDPRVKAAVILGGALVVATMLWIYFSPMEVCIRGYQSTPAAFDRATAARMCAKR